MKALSKHMGSSFMLSIVIGVAICLNSVFAHAQTNSNDQIASILPAILNILLEQEEQELFGLDPSLPPWENFDLTDWALDAPNADPEDGLSARTSDRDFSNGELFSGSEAFFYTGADGGMVFKSPVGGARTSANTSFPRSELREMLRSGNTSISTQGVTANNWALGYQPVNSNIGARNGVLTATLRVNQVTSTGSSSQVGRVIIGQIHADNDEPLRLYYRKLPNNSRGAIYMAHEIRDSDDINTNIIGSRSSNASNPPDGIELGQLFSYEIINEGAVIRVVIRDGDRDGPIIGDESFNMNQTMLDVDDDGVIDIVGSGYDRADEWMYSNSNNHHIMLGDDNNILA